LIEDARMVAALVSRRIERVSGVYRIRIHSRVINLIRGWRLPDEIQEEVDLYLTEILPGDLENNLSRETRPYNGMVCRFSRRDHHVAGREHEFAFHVFFSQDETSLLIEYGTWNLEG
jgi:hypothetical protein